MVDDIPSLEIPAPIVAPNRPFSSFISRAAKSSADVECYLSPGLELVIEAACGYEWRWGKRIEYRFIASVGAYVTGICTTRRRTGRFAQPHTRT